MVFRRVRRVVVAGFISVGLALGAVVAAESVAPTITEAVPAAKVPTPTEKPRRTWDLPSRGGGDNHGELGDILNTQGDQQVGQPGRGGGEIQGPDEDNHDTTVLTKPDVVTETVVRKITVPKGKLLSMPVQGPITSPFGMRFHPILRVTKLHSGTDFGVGCGVPVGASADGTVISAGWAGGYGVQVVIDHGKIAGHDVRTTYNHLSAIGVKAGQKVKTGDGIGLVGSTGYSTGCHLHFEVIADGQFTDPIAWLNGKAVIVDLSKMKTVTVGQPSPSASPSPSSTPTPSPSQTPSSTPASTPSAPASSPAASCGPSSVPSGASPSASPSSRPHCPGQSPSKPPTTKKPLPSSPPETSPSQSPSEPASSAPPSSPATTDKPSQAPSSPASSTAPSALPSSAKPSQPATSQPVTTSGPTPTR